MKRTFKKLFAALLAAALVLAMAVPAFAVTNATKGSITIERHGEVVRPTPSTACSS